MSPVVGLGILLLVAFAPFIWWIIVEARDEIRRREKEK